MKSLDEMRKLLEITAAEPHNYGGCNLKLAKKLLKALELAIKQRDSAMQDYHNEHDIDALVTQAEIDIENAAINKILEGE